MKVIKNIGTVEKVFLLIIMAALFIASLSYRRSKPAENVEVEYLEVGSELVEETISKIEENYDSNRQDITIKYIEHMEKLDSTKDEDLKQWYLDYKDMIEESSEYYEDVPETIYDYYSAEELDMLFRVVQAEIGDEYSFRQKCNVASVIFNRLDHDKFEDEMFKVLTPQQFATISNGRYKKVKVSEDTKLACEFAFNIKDTTDGCVFFDSNGALQYEFAFNDGAHSFYKLKGDNNGR